MNAQHTPGPWAQGRLLDTTYTRRLPLKQRNDADSEERKLVFANFTAEDEGRSRVLIAQCQTEEDARAIAALPDLLAALKTFVITRSVAKSLSQAHAAIAKATGGKPANPTGKHLCAVKGMVRPGAMCGSVIVGGKYCGHDGDCQHKKAEVEA